VAVGGSGVDELGELQRILEASMTGPLSGSGVEPVGAKRWALGH
jgi:hypothetical protein